MIDVLISLTVTKSNEESRKTVNTQSGWVKDLSYLLKSWELKASSVDCHLPPITYKPDNIRKYTSAMATIVRCICIAARQNGPRSIAIKAGQVSQAIRERQIGGSRGVSSMYLDWMFPDIWIEKNFDDDATRTATISLRRLGGYRSANLSSLLFNVSRQPKGSISFAGHSDKRLTIKIEIFLDSIQADDGILSQIEKDFQRNGIDRPPASEVPGRREIDHNRDETNGVNYIGYQSPGCTELDRITHTNWICDEIESWRRRNIRQDKRHGTLCIRFYQWVQDLPILEVLAYSGSYFYIQFDDQDCSYKNFAQRLNNYLRNEKEWLPKKFQIEQESSDTIHWERSINFEHTTIIALDNFDRADQSIIDSIPAQLPENIFIVFSLKEPVSDDFLHHQCFDNLTVFDAIPRSDRFTLYLIRNKNSHIPYGLKNPRYY